MNKYIKITFLFLFLIPINLKAQELSGRVTYNVSLNQTIEEVNQRNKERNVKTSQRIKDRINNARDIFFF